MTMYENPMVVDSYWCDSLSCPDLFPPEKERATKSYNCTIGGCEDTELLNRRFSRKKAMPHVREYFW